jgi:hypothetical protein
MRYFHHRKSGPHPAGKDRMRVLENGRIGEGVLITAVLILLIGSLAREIRNRNIERESRDFQTWSVEE